MSDYIIRDIGSISSIVFLEDFAVSHAGPAELVCTVVTSSGTYKIDTDKFGRIPNGYINISPVENTRFADGARIVTTDPVLIATLAKALFADYGEWTLNPIRQGTTIAPLDVPGTQSVYKDMGIPKPMEAFRNFGEEIGATAVDLP